MRAAIVAAVLASAAALLALACDEDTTPAIGSDPDGGTGSSSSSSGSSSARDAAAVTETDARAPTGCLLSTTGFVEGKKAEVVARTDVQNTASWTNVDRALAADGQFATVTLAAGQESSKLRVSDFGLSIPDTAETWGIEVELKRRAPDGGVEDQQINIEVEGKPSRYKRVDGPWPTTIVGTHVYGQAIDTWGVDMFPADVNKASFAATLTVKRAANATAPVTAVVDSLRVAVHFCKEPIKK